MIMSMKTIKFILGWGFITFLLLSSVVFVDSFFLLIKVSNNSSATSNLYSFNIILLGFISDSIRALFLCYLFPQFKYAGTSILQSIKFGLIISGIMSTLWLLIGYFDLKLEDPNYFLIYDGIIFIIQGVTSGVGLHLLCKKQFI